MNLKDTTKDTHIEDEIFDIDTGILKVLDMRNTHYAFDNAKDILHFCLVTYIN